MDYIPLYKSSFVLGLFWQVGGVTLLGCIYYWGSLLFRDCCIWLKKPFVTMYFIVVVVVGFDLVWFFWTGCLEISTWDPEGIQHLFWSLFSSISHLCGRFLYARGAPFPSWLISRLESQEQTRLLTREGAGCAPAEVFSGRECDLEEWPLRKQCWVVVKPCQRNQDCSVAEGQDTGIMWAESCI